MKKTTLVAGLASLGAVAAVFWTLPAAASSGCSADCDSHEAKDSWVGRVARDGGDDDGTPNASVPEPGTLALLGLGLSGLGITGLSRKRTKK